MYNFQCQCKYWKCVILTLWFDSRSDGCSLSEQEPSSWFQEKENANGGFDMISISNYTYDAMQIYTRNEIVIIHMQSVGKSQSMHINKIWYHFEISPASDICSQRSNSQSIYWTLFRVYLVHLTACICLLSHIVFLFIYPVHLSPMLLSLSL